MFILWTFRSFIESILTLRFAGFCLYYLFGFAIFASVIVMVVHFLRRG